MKRNGSSRISYTARFKLNVVTYALEKGNREAARQFQVDEKNVRRWRSQQEKLKGLRRDQRAARYCPAKFPELEKELKEWIDEKRKAGIGISTTVIRLKAKSMAKVRNVAESDFKASVHWCHRFMDRHDLSIRRRTTISQKLPENFEDKLQKFQAFIITERKKHEYELSLIGNVDQTPLTFDMPANSTVDSKGTKSVSIMTTGHEKDRFTVMLACLGDGTKLPPYVVFKQKTLPKDLVLPRGIHVRAQAKGWMDESLVKDWLNSVWSKVGGLLRKRNFLVWDSFRAHLSDNVKRVLKNSRTDVAVIPGGMTSLLQPLDVGVNKPFKDNLRQYWNKWMLDGNHTFTPAGRIRKPDLRQICQWILESWNAISPDTIKRSFLKCCITNALDGTEDDILWEEMDESDPFADDDGVESIVDEEGELFYAGEDEVAVLEVNEQEYRGIFGESDIDESDFNGF